MGRLRFCPPSGVWRQRGRAGGSGGPPRGPPLPSPEGSPPPACTFSKWLWPLGPRAEAQEPLLQAQWGGASHLGEMGNVGWERKKQPLEQRRGFHVEIYAAS